MRVLFESEIQENLDAPEAGMLYKWHDELYYIFKIFSSYEFIVIPTKPNNEVIDFEKYILFVKTDGSYNIIEKKPFNESDERFKYTGWCEDTIFWNLLIQSDLSSEKGRNVVLENFLSGYDSTIHNLPKWMTTPTSVINWAFKREVDYKKDFVNIKKLVGTCHGRYEGYSWYEIFLLLKREKNFIYALYNPNYYDELENSNQVPKDMSFTKVDDQYFTNAGSHRSTIAKIMGKEKIYAPITVYETDYNYQKAYEELLGLGFEIDFLEDNKFDMVKDEYNIKENWEGFVVKFESRKLRLYGLEMIRKFIEMYKILEIKKSPTFIQVLSNRFSKKSINEEDYLERMFNHFKSKLIDFKVLQTIK